MLAVAETIAKTDTGRQRRENEDSSYARPPVFVVADGMGGAQAGEVASRIAIEAFSQGLPDSGSAEERLATRAREANSRIHELSRTQHERAGMGTTLTAAYLDDAHLSIAHVGDSRAYLLREGVLTRLTQDHSLVDELVRRGKLTEEQAAEHPQRSIITRALGPEPTVDIDTWTYAVRDGDVVLLCSDGLTSMVSEERIAETLTSAPTLDRAAEQLIDDANEAGGRDNITVVLFRIAEVGRHTSAAEATVVSEPAPRPEDQGRGRAARHEEEITPRPAPSALAEPPVRVPLARKQGWPQAPTPERTRRRRRYVKPIAALLAIVIVAFLVVGGGYLASRQLYFVGTNKQGIVTIYRGLPYDLPGGIHLYETFYVSGVPAGLIPADRRATVLNNQLRSEGDAESIVHALETGQLSR